jgi:hypothetical protein
MQNSSDMIALSLLKGSEEADNSLLPKEGPS